MVRTCIEHGVIPILSRFVIEGTPGPFGVATPLGVTGRFGLAQVENDRGEPERVVLNMWADLTGPIARTYPPPPENAGTIAPAGRIFGEHVFTRLFAPPGERRVKKLDLSGAPKTLPRYEQPSFASMVDLPADAKPLDALSPEEFPTAFGVVHTDSNHHVNSLVYLRLFEEAALRRFAKLGVKRGGDVLARKLAIAYRKPCFAGQTMRVHVRVAEVDGRLAAVTAIAPEGAGVDQAHAAARLLFE